MFLDRVVFRQVFVITLTVIYIFFIGWMTKLYVNSQTDSTENLLTTFYTTLSLLGGLYGVFVVAPHWGGWYSNVGKAILFFSFSALAWSLGDVIWMYYNFVKHIDVPYPSWPDAAYIFVNPLWAVGGVFLSIATGASYGLKKLTGKVILIVVPVIAIAISYYFLIVVAQDGVVDFGERLTDSFFNFVYPIGDVAILTIAVLIYALSYKYFGGKYRFAIQIILASFFIGYIGDVVFSYADFRETYYNGSLADLLFATTMYTLALGVALLDSRSVPPRSDVQAKGQVSKLASLIVERQLLIIGPIAWEEAQEIDGLSIDVGRKEVYIEGDSREVLERLVAQYERLFGGASREACREAVRPAIYQVPSDQVPDVLQ